LSSSLGIAMDRLGDYYLATQGVEYQMTLISSRGLTKSILWYGARHSESGCD